jgi:ribosomal protein S12 methylthiotransferase accessory factor
VLRILGHRSIIVTDDAVVLNADTGVIGLRGAVVARLARSVLRFVEEERTMPAVVARFEARDRPHADALMRILLKSGVVIDDERGGAPEATISRFIRLRGGDEGLRRITQAKVLVVGGPAWAHAVVEQIAAAGCGEAVLVDDAGALDESERLPDLVVAVSERDDLATQRAVAKWSHRFGVASLYVSAGVVDLRVGPLVRPSATACWNCCRLRLLANQGTPEQSAVVRDLQAHLISQQFETAFGMQETLLEGLANRFAAFSALEFLAVGERSALAGAVWIFDNVTMSGAPHRVIPLPQCDICGGASSVTDRAAFRIETELTDAGIAETFLGWSDARTGIVSTTWTDEASAQAGAPVVVRALTANYIDDQEQSSAAEVCTGKGFTWPEAFRGAIGECFERYSAARVPTRSLRTARIDDLAGEVLSPASIGLYADEQYASAGFAFERFDSAAEHTWVEGRWLDSCERVWLPAQLIFLAALHDAAPYCQVTTSGLATGRNFEEAAMRAVLELVERDALTLTWLCRLTAPQIIQNVLGAAVSSVLAFLNERNATVELFLLDVGIPVPTVLALGRGDGVRWPGLCAGAAAGRNLSEAVRAAVLELAATGMALTRNLDRAEPIRRPEQIRTDAFGDHARYYFEPARSGAADFLLQRPDASRRTVGPSDDAFSSLHDLAQLLTRSGIRVALADVSSPDIALSGFSVVRALADGLQPLHCGYGTERRGARRLRRFLRGPINPDPHPFC